MADSLPSHHPFADLFALLSPDSIPKWTSVVELLRRLSDGIEPQLQLGEDDDAGTTVQLWLEKLENARDLLRETEEQLVELYFDRHINADLAEAAGALVALGEVQHTPLGDDQEPPDLALGAEFVARQQLQAGSEVVEYEGNAAEVEIGVEICRSLMEVVDLAEGVSGRQGTEVHDLNHMHIEELCENTDIYTVSHQAAAIANSGQAIEVHDLHIEECENAHIQAASHQLQAAAGNSGRAIEVHDLDIEEECGTARGIQAASHQDDGASIQAIEVRRDLDVEDSWGDSRIHRACGQAGGVECEGNAAEVEICQRLKCGMDWDEAASGQASEGHDHVDIEELEMAFVEVAKREGSARHQFEGASGQAAGEEDPDEDAGNYKDVEMS